MFPSELLVCFSKSDLRSAKLLAMQLQRGCDVTNDIHRLYTSVFYVIAHFQKDVQLLKNNICLMQTEDDLPTNKTL